MDTAVATRKPTTFESDLAVYESQFAAVIPDHIRLDKFKRVIMTAVNQNPELVKCDRRSLFQACIMAAKDGLLPDGREAALVAYGNKVQYLPMIAGIRQRMRNTGQVLSAEAHVVYQNDHFDYELGDSPRIEHKPKLGNRGRLVGAYAVIKLKNGEIIRDVMDLADLEKVRAASRAAKSGPWVTWYEEMCRKSVLRRAAKAAPMSSDLEEMIGYDAEPEEPDTGVVPPRPVRPELRIEHHDEPPESDVVDEVQDAEALSQARDALGPPITAGATPTTLPTSPLSKKNPSPWPHWIDQFKAALRQRESTERATLILDSGAEVSYIQQNMPLEWSAIEKMLEEMKGT